MSSESANYHVTASLLLTFVGLATLKYYCNGRNKSLDNNLLPFDAIPQPGFNIPFIGNYLVMRPKGELKN